MTRIVHDQFGKQLLTTLLEPLGAARTNFELGGEVQHADLWFVPHSNASVQPDDLDLIRRLARSACQLEPFRHPPSPGVVRSCMLKLFTLHEELKRTARREKRRLREYDLPILWILMCRGNTKLLREAGCVEHAPDWLPGVYLLAPLLKTGFIAIDELPETPETLWVRLLGSGETQSRAIREVLALPRSHPLRDPSLTLLLRWRIMLQERPRLTRDEKEVMMNLAIDFNTWEQEAEQRGELRGKLEGKLEGQQAISLKLLKLKFGPLDPSVDKRVQALTDPAELDRLVERILTATRIEELELGTDSDHT